MSVNERTILRIRCSKGLFRSFKKVAADYDDYEEALEVLIDAYKNYISIYPESPRSVSDKDVKYSKTRRI